MHRSTGEGRDHAARARAERGRFGAETTTAEVLLGIDLTGKTALVTGASGGLGAETARGLAGRGAEVTLAARNLEKARAVAEQIRGAGNDRVDVMELELDRLASVRRFADRYLAAHPVLSILVNNAGVMACPLGRTAEGHELQFGTNHLGHFLLTGLLAPALRAGAPARVVSVSSAGHRFSAVRFEDVDYHDRPYDKWEAYGQSKTANVLFAVELDRRLASAGVRANAVHPGVILTDLGRHLTPADVELLRSRSPGGRGFRWKSVEAGAATATWAATAPELEGRGGLYLEDCGIAAPKRSAADAAGYESWAVDPGAAARLWEASEQMVGQTFDL
jgi:NAD(P)-dependent dehydrogenase (short-subunit alcohol dehydrogenase family)